MTARVNALELLQCTQYRQWLPPGCTARLHADALRRWVRFEGTDWSWTVPAKVQEDWCALVDPVHLRQALEHVPGRWADLRLRKDRLIVEAEEVEAGQRERWRASIHVEEMAPGDVTWRPPEHAAELPLALLARALQATAPAWTGGSGHSSAQVRWGEDLVVSVGSERTIASVQVPLPEEVPAGSLHIPPRLAGLLARVLPGLEGFASTVRLHLLGTTVHAWVGPFHGHAEAEGTLPDLREYLSSRPRRPLFQADAEHLVRALTTVRGAAPGMDVMLSYLSGELGILTVESHVWGQYEIQIQVQPGQSPESDEILVASPLAVLAACQGARGPVQVERFEPPTGPSSWLVRDGEGYLATFSSQ